MSPGKAHRAQYGEFLAAFPHAQHHGIDHPDHSHDQSHCRHQAEAPAHGRRETVAFGIVSGSGHPSFRVASDRGGNLLTDGLDTGILSHFDIRERPRHRCHARYAWHRADRADQLFGDGWCDHGNAEPCLELIEVAQQRRQGGASRRQRHTKHERRCGAR